ncbi:MAG: F0F1 ATP synthase subunit A [Opitutaceae bacterium]|jgi:F-type H+-transporting ATPase subunit a
MLRVNKLTLFATLLMTGLPPAFAAEEHGVDQSAEALFHLGPFPVTNSMVTSWVVAALLILAVRLFVGRPRLIPTRGQAVLENLLVGVRDLTGPIVGPKVAKHVLPLLLTLFVFILIQNWSGLVPGVGTLYYHGTEIVRPGNADLNGTVALAVVSISCWLYFILRYAGPRAVLRDIFGNKANKNELPSFIYYPLFVMFFLVGIIELISIAFRPVSLSFRLFGNVYGGENLLHAMSSISRWGLPIPFYFLELIIGVVQALVFTLLVSVYIGLICNHGGSDHKEDSHDGHASH